MRLATGLGAWSWMRSRMLLTGQAGIRARRPAGGRVLPLNLGYADVAGVLDALPGLAGPALSALTGVVQARGEFCC